MTDATVAVDDIVDPRSSSKEMLEKARDLADNIALKDHPGKSVLEETLEELAEKRKEEKDKAFSDWLATSLEAGTCEDAPRDLLFRIGFYAGYDIGSIPVGDHGIGSTPPLEFTAPTDKLKTGLSKMGELLNEATDPVTPKGYGELKVGEEAVLNGMPVRVRKITKKDVVLRPLNKAIRDKHGMIVSKKDGKAHG